MLITQQLLLAICPIRESEEIVQQPGGSNEDMSSSANVAEEGHGGSGKAMGFGAQRLAKIYRVNNAIELNPHIIDSESPGAELDEVPEEGESRYAAIERARCKMGKCKKGYIVGYLDDPSNTDTKGVESTYSNQKQHVNRVDEDEGRGRGDVEVEGGGAGGLGVDGEEDEENRGSGESEAGGTGGLGDEDDEKRDKEEGGDQPRYIEQQSQHVRNEAYMDNGNSRSKNADGYNYNELEQENVRNNGRIQQQQQQQQYFPRNTDERGNTDGQQY